MNGRVRPELEAEQALLGACLSDPAQLGAVLGWLESRHFYRPAHRAFFAILLAQHEAEHPALAENADQEERKRWAMDASATASRTVPGFGPGQAHTLIANCPNARHAAAYGRMVLENSVRRTLEEHADRLLNAARSGDADSTARLSEALANTVAKLAGDWGSIDRRGTAPPPATAAPNIGERAADRAQEHERMLLSALTTRPSQIREIAVWLNDEDFLDEGHRSIYQAVVALAHRREPVDELTVLWEVRRRGGLSPAGLTAAQVRQACAGDYPADPAYFAELVLRGSLLRSAATSAGIVRVMAMDAAVSAAPLLGATLQALAPTRDAGRRLHALDSPPPPEMRSGQVIAGARRQGAALARSHTPARTTDAPAAASPDAAARPPARSAP